MRCASSLGVVVATVVGDRRLEARGGREGAMADVATWAVPFGLVGARLYHLATNPELYWGGPGRPGTIGALKIWDGGLGIWGGVLFGALGAWIALPALRPRLRDGGGLAGPGAAARAGGRPLGQLVQPGAVRPSDRAALGAAHRRRAPDPGYLGRRATTSRRSSTSRSGTSGSRWS